MTASTGRDRAEQPRDHGDQESRGLDEQAVTPTRRRLVLDGAEPDAEREAGRGSEHADHGRDRPRRRPGCGTCQVQQRRWSPSLHDHEPAEEDHAHREGDDMSGRAHRVRAPGPGVEDGDEAHREGDLAGDVEPAALGRGTPRPGRRRHREEASATSPSSRASGLPGEHAAEHRGHGGADREEPGPQAMPRAGPQVGASRRRAPGMSGTGAAPRPQSAAPAHRSWTVVAIAETAGDEQAPRRPAGACRRPNMSPARRRSARRRPSGPRSPRRST